MNTKNLKNYPDTSKEYIMWVASVFKLNAVRNNQNNK